MNDTLRLHQTCRDSGRCRVVVMTAGRGSAAHSHGRRGSVMAARRADHHIAMRLAKCRATIECDRHHDQGKDENRSRCSTDRRTHIDPILTYFASCFGFLLRAKGAVSYATVRTVRLRWLMCTQTLLLLGGSIMRSGPDLCPSLRCRNCSAQACAMPAAPCVDGSARSPSRRRNIPPASHF